LALFGRRPHQRVNSPVMPATENLHNNGHFAEWNLGDKSLAPYNREAFVLAFLVQRF
jgi:hypothetical protein